MTPDLSVVSKKTVGQRIAANTGLMVGAKAFGVIMGIGSLVLAARVLDPAAFGIILFLHAYMLFFSEVATFQSWQSIIRFGSDDLKNGDYGKLSELLNFGIKLDAIAAVFAYVFALLVFGVIVELVGAFPNTFPQTGPMDITTLRNYVAGYSILMLLRQRGASIGVFRLFDKFSVLAIKAVIMPVVRFVGVIVAVLLDAGFHGILLAWFCGSLMAYLFLPIMALLELKSRHLLKPVFRAKIRFWSPREGVWPFVVKSNIDSTLAAANQHLPLLLVMGVFGSAWVAVYKIAEELAKMLSEGFVLLDQVIYPELAKMVAMGDAEKIWRLVTRAAAILLSFGLFMSLLVFILGPEVLSRLMSKDYSAAAPLTSLLVPAAALLGTAAPLYPVLYAANHPERAIYARGAGVLVYIISFFIFSALIGPMAPGWAALLGNSVAVILVVILAKRTLNKTLAKGRHIETMSEKITPLTSAPIVKFVGDTNARLWGMPLLEWQTRAFKKAGAVSDKERPANLFFDVRRILSAELSKAFVARSNTALVVDGQIIGVNGTDAETAEKLVGQGISALEGTNLEGLSPDDLDDGYIKTLRKFEPPYALDITVTPNAEITKRQFASSYKGITDFVTKWVWPWPAYHVTRACAALRLTPNMVTTVGLVLTFAALYFFWQGQWALGFAAGWVMTFLDTVDGKLARTTMTYSKWGNAYDHGIDLIHPPFWYVAWFVGLGGVFTMPESLIIWPDMMSLAVVAICVGYVVDRLIEGLFIVQHGFHIHVWRPINSAMRFITARRNPNMALFMIGICLMPFFPQAGEWGFYAVAIWTWACIAFNICVVLAGMIAKGPLHSWMDR